MASKIASNSTPILLRCYWNSLQEYDHTCSSSCLATWTLKLLDDSPWFLAQARHTPISPQLRRLRAILLAWVSCGVPLGSSSTPGADRLRILIILVRALSCPVESLRSQKAAWSDDVFLCRPELESLELFLRKGQSIIRHCDRTHDE